MNWIWAALAPHPPIIVPEVGQGREEEASKTLAGMAKLTSTLSADEGYIPDRLLILSPHEPYVPGGFFMNSASSMSGSLAPFRAPEVEFRLSSNGASFNALAQHLNNNGIPTADGPVEDITRDHGSLVPLYFLEKAWGRLPQTIIANPSGLTVEGAYRLGEVLASFDDGHRWALLASGDLSHRLSKGAPAGYSPAGELLDKAIVEALKSGSANPIKKLTPKNIEDAGECGLRPTMVLLGLCKNPLEVFSYEGPFGVGYCTAAKILAEKEAGRLAGMKKDCHIFPALARKTLEAHLAGKVLVEKELDDMTGTSLDDELELLQTRKACFVTIKSSHGDLRGCIGTILPVRPSLKDEIMANAISAATQDPRFPAMKAEELESCRISVDVLSEPEAVTSIKDLDPSIYGVIVTKGSARGLLLPDLDGVDSVEQQLAIAAQKGGIHDISDASIKRFKVERYPE